MEKYPKSGEKKKPKHKHIIDARIGKSEGGPAGFNYEESVKNLNKYYISQVSVSVMLNSVSVKPFSFLNKVCEFQFDIFHKYSR